jgi:NAD(P)-dependent dehydrogenase (short-subunit alcohol dehydrogenase family)
MTKTSNPFSLKNKTVIVTGASSGIGRQCALSCSFMGARVILLGRNSDRLKETLNCMNEPSLHLTISIDLTDYERTQDAVNQIIAKTGKIHGLINCAGISTTLPLNLCKPVKMDEFFQTNVHSAINLTRIVTKQSNISEECASIVFISSIMGVVGENGKSLYSLTKGALVAGAKSLAIELASRNIRVNCISPGVVESPMSKNAVYSRNEESLNKIKGLHPIGLGKPEDVANACIYLLSDASRWVTGTNLIVDGGYTAR